MIMYKVICSKCRCSAVECNCKASNRVRSEDKYVVHYPPKSVVVAPTGTLGLFLFDTDVLAENFLDLRDIVEREDKSGVQLCIIKVKPLCRSKRKIERVARPKCLDRFYTSLDRLYANRIYSTGCVFPGTVTCQKIYTLE